MELLHIYLETKAVRTVTACLFTHMRMCERDGWTQRKKERLPVDCGKRWDPANWYVETDRERARELEWKRERGRACERVGQFSLYIAPDLACVNWGLQSSHKRALVNIPTLSYLVMLPSPPSVGQPCNFKLRSFETIILSPAGGWVIDVLTTRC